jgi:uncharacterized protein (TIGR02118 family)
MRKANEIKIVRLVKRRADLSLAQFKNYWLTRHAEHERQAIEATPLQKVVASISTGEVALGGADPPFDGMVALYFRSLEDARATLSGPGTAAMREDAKNFVDPRSSPQLFADEYLVSEKQDAPGTIRRSGQLKTIRTISRRRDLTHAQFKDYWLNQHSRLEREVIETTSMQRIVASFALPENLLREGRGHPCDVRGTCSGDDAQGRGELRADERPRGAARGGGVCDRGEGVSGAIHLARPISL